MTKHTCTECGTEFTPGRKNEHFCSTACRKAFNNRRAVRGAILYDAVMAKRYDRKGEFTGLSEKELRNIVDHLAMAWNEDDKVNRDGRRSYANINDWINKNPWFKALRSTWHNIAGTRGTDIRRSA
jgi:hypothetical protein